MLGENTHNMKKKIELPQVKISVKVKRPLNYTPYLITSSIELADLVRQLFDEDTFDFTEEMILLCFNRRIELLHYSVISKGGMSGTVCDPKVVMMIALQNAADSIVLAHNHPSGNLKPSSADLSLTQKIKDACSLLDIRFIDHIILTYDGFYSMADEGKL